MSSNSPDREHREKKAQRYVNRGQLDKAIQEYQRMLEADRHDKRILNKLAEVQERNGDQQEAVVSWMRLAKYYSRGGYPQQAISVYKHVLELRAGKIEARLLLAEEYAREGFNLDAVEQFMESVTQLELAGKSSELLTVYRRLVELQPQNVDYRLRLSQLLAQFNQTSAASEMLSETAMELARSRRTQEFVFWGERALDLEPLNVELLNGLARVYLSQGNTEQAMIKLEPSLRADPYNVETLWLLATVFHGDGQPGKVRLIHQRLSEMCEQQDDPQRLRAAVARVERLLPAEQPKHKPMIGSPRRTPIADLTDQDDVPEIGSAEFFMLEENAGPKVQISPDFLGDVPEIPPEDFVIIR